MKGMQVNFDGKTAVVFGGSRGIGNAIVKELGKAGATVYTCSQHEEYVNEAHSEFTGLGLKVVSGVVNTPEEDQVDGFIQKALKETGRLDMVVNNAGIVGMIPFIDADSNELRRLLDVNVIGVNNGTRAALKHMIPFKAGKIVNISSCTGHRGVPGFPHYGMTKAAVLYLTQCAAYSGAPHGINVNAVCPGIVRTPMWETILDERVKTMGPDRDKIFNERVAAACPLGRPQSVEDIAYAVAFLCSKYADQMTGQALNVDGGYCIG